MTRVGVIGYGNVGRRLVRFLEDDPRFALDFVVNRSAEALREFDQELVLTSLDELPGRDVDLVVEAAHPRYVTEWGQEIVKHADFAPLSVAGLADAKARELIVETARAHDHQLFVLRGVIPAFETLKATKWHSASVTFVKHPDYYDFEAFAQQVPDFSVDTSVRQVLYTGKARDVAELFPRNINAMIALGLATVGLDDLDCTVVSDPEQRIGVLEIDARADDGHSLSIVRKIPMGYDYLFSSLYDVLDRAHSPRQGLAFV